MNPSGHRPRELNKGALGKREEIIVSNFGSEEDGEGKELAQPREGGLGPFRGRAGDPRPI